MTHILLGLLMGVLCSFHIPSKDCTLGKAMRWWIVKAILFTIASSIWQYNTLPAHTGLFIGEGTWWWVAWLLFINCITHLVSEASIALPVVALVGIGGSLLIAEIARMPIFRSGDMAGLIGTVEKKPWTESLAPIDPAHIRLVSKEQAEWLGRKTIDGGLGSVYQPGPYSLQKVGGDLYWVAALDYQGFRRWASGDPAPGFVMVNAHDPSAPPKLVKEDLEKKPIALRYTPEAFFGDNLERHVYSSGYANYYLEGFHLELDDQHRPFWIVAAMKPTIVFGGSKVKLVLVVNPTTGAIEEFTPDKAPAWIDRVVPQETAVSYLEWWGEYHSGWWKAFVGAPNLVEPTSDHHNPDKAWLIYGADGKCYWYSGITSRSEKDTDDTLLSFVLMDSRTGVTTEYTITGTTAGTAKSALTVADQSVRNFAGYHSTMPIPYNVYGHLAYVVPIVGASHIFERVAIVDITCQRVALGETKHAALQLYKQQLSQASGNSGGPTTKSELRNTTFKVDRVAKVDRNGNTIVYLWSAQFPNRAFFGSGEQGTAILLTEKGDTVTVQYLDTTETEIPVAGIQNGTVAIGREGQTK